MANLDRDTKEFAAAIDGPKPAPSQVETALRTARAVMKDPKKFLARKALATALVGDEGSSKIASVADDPVALFHKLTELYGRDWYDWEPETLWHSLSGSLPSDEQGDITSEHRNRIMALQVAVNTDAPFEHWHVFENIANAFAGNPVDFGILQPIELTEAARAVRILLDLRPKAIFDDEVWGYVAAIAKQSGVVCLPPSLFAGARQPQEILDTLNNDLELRSQVSERWPQGPRPGDTLALKIQLLRLKEIEEAASA